MRVKATSGATITSVLVAAALAGIVAAVVSQLISNQSKVMRTLTLREERENLLKHYRNTLIAGWDHTLSSGCGDLYDRAGDVAVPSSGLKVKSDDLYSNTNLSDGWWEVKFNCGDKSGSIFASDKYDKISGSGLHDESHKEVTLTVNFLKDNHPHISSRLAERKEKFYMHQQKRLAGDTDCRHEGNRSRRNYLKRDVDRAKTIDSSIIGDFALYKGTGAVIQYDFNTNYVKCSQVPLVKPGACAHDAAIIGFWGTMAGGTTYPYVDGNYVCSHNGNVCNASNPHLVEVSAGHDECLSSIPPGKTGKGGYDGSKSRHPKVDYTPLYHITAYRGDGGDSRHLGHFGSGCLKSSNPSNHTYVSFIDGKGTAYCQHTRHVVENNTSCSTYPNPRVPFASYNAAFQEPDGYIDAWGDTGNPLGNGAEENTYEGYVRRAIDAARARGHTPPSIPGNYFSRKERDTVVGGGHSSSWVLGSGGFLEFAGFDHSSGKEPGYHVSKTETPNCSTPGYEKGLPGPPGPPGGNGIVKGSQGDAGKWVY